MPTALAPFFSNSSGDPRDLHSFPTRRSSDLLHHGMLPLIDLIFAEEGGEEFVELALARTDARVRAGKTVSPSFLFAALLRSEEHTSELQSRPHLVCRLLLEKKKPPTTHVSLA